MPHAHLLVFAIAAVMLILAARPAGGQEPARPTLYYIPHTHWEGAVFFTREEYLESGLSHLLTALHLLAKYPEYKMALDQVAYIKPLLERYPEEAAAFHKFVKEGRLAIAGGMDIMPDDVKPGGESFIRQMIYGKQYCSQELGVEVTVSWMLDTFGHHPQLPQLLKKAGFKSFWFCRGVKSADSPSEFTWRGIDGSEIAAFRLPGFYGLFWGPPRDVEGLGRFFQERYDSLSPNTKHAERVGLAGVDVCDFEEYVPPLIRQHNAKPDAKLAIRYSTPAEFADLVAKRKDVPVLDWDLNPIFQGTYSSRPELRLVATAVEQQLVTAEKLGVVLNLLGDPQSDADVWRAWEPLLFNQAHDIASGVMTDRVHEDTAQIADYSKRLADELIETRTRALASHIDTRGEGIPVVVRNPLGWARTDATSMDLGFAEHDVRGIRVIAPDGTDVPAQATAVELFADGTVRRAKVTFVARDVPAMGHATYRVITTSDPPAVLAVPAPAAGDTLENEFVRVRVDLGTGAIMSVFDKGLGSEMLSGPGNVVARQDDHGDLWEPYHTLDGAMCVASTEVHPVPSAANGLLSTAYADKPGVVVKGPVFDEFTVTHPFADGSFATRVRVYQGVRRVDVETTLVNNTKQTRFQVLFPTTIQGGHNVQEIPFGAIERPVGVEYPAQHWVDYSDGKRGLALLNNGMPGNLVNENTLILSLLRSQTLGDYNEGRTSESGYALGLPRTFRYALIPHGGDWREAGIYRTGSEFNNPLAAQKASPHPGALPAGWSLAQVSDPAVLLTCAKPGPGKSTILRVYEATGKPAKGVKLHVAANVTAAWEADLLDRAGKKLKVEDNTLTLDLGAFEIKTVKVKLGR